MASNVVIGSVIKLKMTPSGSFDSGWSDSSGYNVAELYVNGKYSEKVVSYETGDVGETMFNISGEDAAYLILDTTGFSAGSLYAKVTLPYTDGDTGDAVKSISIVDTGIRLVNA